MAKRQIFLALVIASAALGYQADNTQRNKRDRDGTTKTADKQGNSKSDLEMLARIRRAISKDKSLSRNAHNVKIVVDEGHVWLRGPVATEAEMSKVLAYAKASAGESNVTSYLEVTKETNK